jgi:Raf kinase inhibitor-like YbhB/YbcL family protein
MNLAFIAVLFLAVNALNVQEALAMKMTSSAFENNQNIPSKHTCEGQDVSPALHITDIPTGTKSLAIVVDDPDAPKGTFDHWIAWNIPANTKDLAEGASVPKQGTNGFSEQRYRGPCPPPGKPHRYFFKLYALDAMIDIPAGSSKKALEQAMEGHILGQTQLVGLYKR